MPTPQNSIGGSEQGSNAGPPPRRPDGGSAGKGLEPNLKKSLRLYPSKIDAAMAVLGTSTASETIEAALDIIVDQHDLTHGVESMYGAGLTDLFGGE